MHTTTLCNCVLIYLLACLNFGFICLFECLPYFLQWFCALLNWFFFGHYAYLLLFDVCRVLSVSIARFFVDLRRFGFLFVALQTLRDWYFAICFPFTSFELFLLISFVYFVRLILLVVFCHFTSCLHIRRTQLFVCLCP